MAMLDKTLPTNDCSICILAPKLSDCFRHPNVKIHSLTQVQEISKNGRGFKVKLLKKARFVNEDTCINCGLCVEKCPMKVLDIFDMKMRKRKAVYIYYLQGVPAVMAIEKEKCLYLKNKNKEKRVCGFCEDVCEHDAIDFTQTDTEYSIDSDAIIMASGSNQYDPTPLYTYGYKKWNMKE